jgi:hypothetical protein
MATKHTASKAQKKAKPKPRPRKSKPTPDSMDTHRPPIIVDDGSLQIFSPDAMTNKTNSGNPDRPEKLEGSAEYISIAVLRVFVLTRNEIKENAFHMYSDTDGAQLQIWLQKLKADEDWDPTDAAKPKSQILIKGSPFTIESDKKMKAHKKAKQNQYRPFKFAHPGYSGSDRFRVVKWRTHKPNGTELHKGELGIDEETFTFVVGFHDEHDERSAKG